MQNVTETILRAINRKKRHYNILAAPTHESYQTGLSGLPHTFYLMTGNGLKTWDTRFRAVPENHILLDGTKQQIRPDMKFDLILCMNRFDQFQIMKPMADRLNIPMIAVEHTLAIDERVKRNHQAFRADINVFITPFQLNTWGWNKDDPTIRMIPCGVDNDFFVPDYSKPKNGKILTVVNDYINRDYYCGFKVWQQLTQGLPVNPIGNTEGFSKPAKDVMALLNEYQTCGVFLNTSTWSTMPNTLLEAMSTATPIVTMATCSIPDWIEDGVNGFCSNDLKYLREKLEWCLANPEEAKEFGKRARQTVLDKLSLKMHTDLWSGVFDGAFDLTYKEQKNVA